VKRLEQTLLEVWQEVCRHIEMDESVARAAPILEHVLPIDLLIVRRLDVKRSCVETIAVGRRGPGPLPHRTRSECVGTSLERLMAWCKQDRILRSHASAIVERFPDLLPQGTTGSLLAGPLNAADGSSGILVLAARGEKEFSPNHERIFRALLEPFTVAFENDHRLRELVALREAAEAENESLLSRLGRVESSEPIVGSRSGLKLVMDRVELVCQSHVPVLILGETGSGKEVVARAIHTGSPRRQGPFLRVNCGAIPPDLIDSELFGHEKGSFTGAVGQKRGWFERADGGTLFLDEIGELTLAAQVRLLRILEDGSYERVGGERELTVDVRIIAATHRDLPLMVSDGRFREDLWYRLAVFPIRLPALRERSDDVGELATHFALRSAKRFGLPPLVPTPEDVRLLAAYPWPGNVRELRAVIERAAILGNGRRLEIATALGIGLPPMHSQSVSSTAPPPSSRPDAAPGKLSTLDQAMAEHIERALTATRGRIEGGTGAARILGINPYTLRARMRKLGVDWRKFRPQEIEM
jgi:transcriptional regulator with GAF, ATPase, and Fis domain